MWIIIRLVVALIAGIAKFYLRQTSVAKRCWSQDLSWVYREARRKRRVVRTWYGVSFDRPVFFRLSHETPLDRFCKAIGFSHELQTGDEKFDRKIYVACDHPAVRTVLQENRSLRSDLVRILGSTTERIYSDGVHLWVMRRGGRSPSEGSIRQLKEVADALHAVLPATPAGVFRDPFFWKALLVESIAWSAALYGGPAILELHALPHPRYFDWFPILGWGLVMAVALFAVLVAISWITLRGSSRAHRVFVESALVLALGVPLSSIQIVSDINTGMDRSSTTEIAPVIRSKYIRTTRGSRGGRRTYYHIGLARVNAPVPIPNDLQVDEAFYATAQEGASLVIQMRAGALAIPWVENVFVRR